MHILLLEPNDLAAEAVTTRLNTDGHTVERADTADMALALAKTYPFDAALAEMELPDVSGFAWLREVRRLKLDLPIIAITGLYAIDDKKLAFDSGVDDWLSKPYNPVELQVRLQAVVRRRYNLASPEVQVGNLRIEMANRLVYVDRHRLNLTDTEYRLLEFCALHKGTVLTKDRLLAALYGLRADAEPHIKIVDVYVHKIRKKLAAFDCTARIETSWGRGYLMAEPVEVAA